MGGCGNVAGRHVGPGVVGRHLARGPQRLSEQRGRCGLAVRATHQCNVGPLGERAEQVRIDAEGEVSPSNGAAPPAKHSRSGVHEVHPPHGNPSSKPGRERHRARRLAAIAAAICPQTRQEDRLGG